MKRTIRHSAKLSVTRDAAGRGLHVPIWLLAPCCCARLPITAFAGRCSVTPGAPNAKGGMPSLTAR